MRKAINTGFGNTEKIEIIDFKKPVLFKNEVLVKVVAAGLNPKDILIRKGKFRRLTGRNFPQGIGFDFSGIIEDPNHSKYKEGDQVFGMLNGWQGRCCAEYLNIKVDELYKMRNYSVVL